MRVKSQDGVDGIVVDCADSLPGAAEVGLDLELQRLLPPGNNISQYLRITKLTFLKARQAHTRPAMVMAMGVMNENATNASDCWMSYANCRYPMRKSAKSKAPCRNTAGSNT